MSLQAANEHFDRVSQTLQSGGSLRCKLFALDNFLAEADKNPRLYEAFILELTELLPDADQVFALRGVHPDRLESCLYRCRRIQRNVEELKQLESWNAFVDDLKRSTAAQFTYCGAYDRIYSIYYDGVEAPKWLSELHYTDTSEQLKLVFERAQLYDTSFADFLEELAERLSKAKNKANEQVNVPVVESCRNIQGVEYSGRMVTMHLQFFEETDESDQLEILSPYYVQGAQNAADYIFNPILKVVKSTLSTAFPQIESKTFSGIIRFDPHSANYEGRSAEVATAVILYMQLLNKFDPRSRISVKPDLALTGMLGADGTIEEIDPQTLELKVEAAFFSPIQNIVVPAKQYDDAKEIADGLLRRFPNKTLKIFGVRSLDDLVNDRRLTDYTRDNVLTYYSREAWKHRYSTTSAVVILLMAVTIFRLAYGPIDRNPYHVSYSGSSLFVENRHGNTLDEIEVTERTVDRANESSSWHTHALYDITQNGKNDVFWATNAEYGTRNADVLSAICSESDSLLWSQELNKEISYPNTPDVQTPLFSIEEVKISNFGRFDDPLLVVRATHHNYFPSLVILIDPRNGDIKQTYHHSGKLGDMALLDVTGNGYNEIVLTGINNAFDQAVLLALDPQNLDGQGPHTDRYYTSDFERASESQYIRIPQTIIGKTLRYINRYNEGLRIQFNEEKELILLRVEEYSLSSDDLLNANEARLHYYFNYNLELQGITRHNSYDLASRQMFDEGHIDKKPGIDYFEQHSDSLLYLVDDDWVLSGEISESEKKSNF